MLAVLFVAAVLRGHLNNAGVPGLVFPRPDEGHYVHTVMAFLDGRWSVEYFQNPPLYSYLLYGATVLWGGLLVLVGRCESFAAFVQEAGRSPEWVTLVGRSLSIACSSASVAVLAVLGRRLFSPVVGLVAAAALAVNFTHQQRAPLAGNESLMVLLVLLQYSSLARYLQAPGGGRHAWCGVLAGLAVAAKYNAGVVLLPLLVASLAVRPRHFQGLWWCAPGFLLGSPAALLHPRAFLEGFRSQASFLHGGYTGRDLALDRSGLAYYVERFAEGAGLPFALLCGVGLLLAMDRALRRRSVPAMLLLAGTLPLLLYLATGIFHQIRFLLPAIPLLLLGGAWALATVLRQSRRFSGAGASLLAAAVLLAPAAVAGHRAMAREYGAPDPRRDLWRWVQDHLEPTSRYLELAYPARNELLSLRPDRFDGTPFTRLLGSEPTLEALRARIEQGQFDGLLLNLPVQYLYRMDALPDRTSDPTIRDCPYWDELVLELQALERGPVVKSHDGRIAVCLLALPQGRSR